MLRHLQHISITFLLIFFISASTSAYSAEKVQKEDSIGNWKQKERQLDELIVKKKKIKYSKKNNPAVDLMQLVRKHKQLHNPASNPYYNYDKYEKMLIGINDFKGNFENPKGKLAPKLSFFSNFVDTAAWTGKRILDLSLKEKASTVLSGRERGGEKEIVRGIRNNGLDEGFNQENIRKALEDVVREIDIYSNDIVLMQNRFVSPLSAIAADYYKFEITDTLPIGRTKCIELSFAPHNPESFGFNGKLYISLDDSVRYVRRVSMRVPKAINLNYVDNLFISQNFEIDSLGYTHKTLDDVTLEMSLIPGTQSLYGSRQTRYDNFSYTELPALDEIAKGLGKEFELPGAGKRDGDFWESERKLPLSHAESRMGDMMTTMRRYPIFYWGEKVLSVLVNGYITTGNPSKFDIGPMNTSLSFNTAEGARLRVGGMTTPALSPRLFTKGYVAYGTSDHKLKYGGELEYSFIDKKYTSREFPVKSIRATYQYDTDQLGQHYLFTNPDNIFLSLKRMKSDLITYRRLAKLEYNLELRNNLSFAIELRHEKQEATQWVPFINGYDKNVPSFEQGVAKFMIRYAPGEKFVQGATLRQPVNMDAPIFMLTHEYGPRHFLGADFSLNKTEISIQKRFWFSAFGYTDVVVKGGGIWSQVPFPALLWQNANISYTIQPEAFTLLNPMEFAMDRFASWDITYFMNGALLNRVPIIKKSKLREVFSFKGFAGKLTDRNNPALHPELFRFPADAATQPMGSRPYMEVSAGLDNILTILRLEYVWRLSYRDRPGIDKSGLRIALHFSF